jgi:nucleotide-binding universal stress UspA family protein
MKVLAAIDFGAPSFEALRQARTLAHDVGGPLAVCHVLPPMQDLSLYGPEQAVWSPNYAAEDAETRKQLVEGARAKLGLELTEVFVERGAPYAEIVRRAEEWGADYITIGTHGHRGLARAVLGSVAERVVRHAHCSVLVAREVQKPGVVLVATDLSEPSLPTIAAGAAAAKRSNARLVVASVLEWSSVSPSLAAGLIGALPAIPPSTFQQERRGALQTVLEGAVASVGASAEVRILDGSPPAEIVACADELGAELIVVGTHGRTGLSRLALGSVAERVVRGASCSVLTVRPAAAAKH